VARVETSRLTLSLKPPEVRAFGALLQRGVAVPAETGCSVLRFFTEQLGIHPEYVAARITTVFMDGKVVDALDAAKLRDGSLLALSAALPGLVGATLRRSGTYSAMRSEITRAADDPGQPFAIPVEGVVRVKLFNLLIEELGPLLLAHGILLEREEARDVLEGFVPHVAEASAGGRVFLRACFA
jgi:hypothetical protein